MNTLTAMIVKDIRLSMKNFYIYSTLLMSPLLGFIMGLNTDAESRGFLFTLFVFMNIFVSGINITACLISEEKELRTLNTLILANASPAKIIFSKMLSGVILTTVANIALYFIMDGSNVIGFAQFILSSFLATIAVLIVGSTIGAFTTSQLKASSIAGLLGVIMIFSTDVIHSLAPTGIILEIIIRTLPFSFSRMLMMYGNEYFTFGQDVFITLVNVIVLLGLFAIVYRKRIRVS